MLRDIVGKSSKVKVLLATVSIEVQNLPASENAMMTSVCSIIKLCLVQLMQRIYQAITLGYEPSYQAKCSSKYKCHVQDKASSKVIHCHHANQIRRYLDKTE